MGREDDRKSHRRDGSSRSSKHRDKDSSSSRHHHHDHRNNKKEESVDDRSKSKSNGENKILTKEEEKLYAKARAYVEREEDHRRRSENRRGTDRGQGEDASDVRSIGSRDGRGRRDHDRHRSSSSKKHRQEKERKRRDSRDGSVSDASRDGKHHGKIEDESRRRHDGKHHRKDSRRDKDDHRHRSRESKSDRKKERKRSRSKDRQSDERDHHKKKKKSKHSHQDGEKREKKKHNDSKTDESFRSKASPIEPSKLVPLGEIITDAPSKSLDPETNYFSHNSHLRLYLYRKYGIYFEDLTSSESRDAFAEFTDNYNAGGKLEKVYYDPKGVLPQEALDQCHRTKHQWKFRTNRVEEQSLEMVRAGVKKQTEYDAGNDGRGPAISNKGASAPSTKTVSVAPRNPNEQYGANDGRRKALEERENRRLSDEKHRERYKLAKEEGKPDSGFERQMEKRQQRSEAIHGSAKDRESEAWGGAELDDDAIYGSGGVDGHGRGRRGGAEVSFNEAVSKQRQYREKKEAEKAARTSELMKKEEEKQKKMFEMLGITAGQKITIAPRNDPGGGGAR